MKSNYFVGKDEFANESMMNADGHFNFDDNFGFGNNEFDYDGQSMLNATGNTSGKSQPYIIILTNTTTADITNITLLNASNSIATGGAISGCSIVYNIPGVTYQEFLYSTLVTPFSVGLTRLASSNQLQVTQTISVTTKDPNGNLVTKPFACLIDSYQQQNNQVDLSYDYVVNGMTSLVVSRLIAGLSLYIYLFPSMKVNPISELTAGKSVTGYNNPNINKSLGAKK